MLTCKDIRIFLNSNLILGEIFHIRNILNMIERNFGLSDEDWEPHTKTRKTTYPRWKHRVQATLSSMKKENILDHSPSKNLYIRCK